MPRGGHNRKPRRCKIIQGTFRKDRNPDREPEPRPVLKVPRPPSGMGRFAREFWKQVAAELVEQGLLTNMDIVSLRLCCEAYGLYQEAREAIYHPYDSRTRKRKRRTLAEYLKGRNSQTIPELTTLRTAERSYKSYLSEFGLSPAGRNRIHLPKAKEPGLDPMEKLLSAT